MRYTTYTYRIGLILLSYLALMTASAQDERGLTRGGNKQFNKGQYSDAEASYRKALEKKNNFQEADFNLGDAVYQQKRYEEAVKQFTLTSKTMTDAGNRAAAYHNLGNSYVENKDYPKAIDAYQNALRLRPQDRDTKYNLAYANAMMKQQNQDKKNNKDNKNKQNQDKKDQPQDPKDQDKKDQDKPGQGDPKDNKDKPEPKRGNRQELSKEQAEKLLQALKAEEQKAQEKMQKKTAKPADTKILKDW
jgi:Ca-activated chloride channel homolog